MFFELPMRNIEGCGNKLHNDRDKGLSPLSGNIQFIRKDFYSTSSISFGRHC